MLTFLLIIAFVYILGLAFVSLLMRRLIFGWPILIIIMVIMWINAKSKEKSGESD
ncbi:MAG: hypothetical protein WC227_01455 [Patescibacteria group bacterium]